MIREFRALIKSKYVNGAHVKSGELCGGAHRTELNWGKIGE